MTPSVDLLNRIEATLQGVAASGLTPTTDMNDLYEVYVFGLLVQAAKAELATVSYEDCTGQPTTGLVFPTSPRHLTTATNLYTHAVLDFPKPAPVLEAHVGLYVLGSSGCYHELDVVVIKRDEAQALRASGKSKALPSSGSVSLFAECKFYTSGMGILLARAYWGLQAEYGSKPSFFVLNAGQASVQRYLMSRKDGRDYQPEVVPSMSASEARLRGLFQEIFKSHRMAR